MEWDAREKYYDFIIIHQMSIKPYTKALPFWSDFNLPNGNC